MNGEALCKGSILLGTACRQCSKCMEEMRSLRQEGCPDLDLERRALEACGYRVHVKERNGARWLMAVKGFGVRYEHWHPLTNIHHAMQLLIEAPSPVMLSVRFDRVLAINSENTDLVDYIHPTKTPLDLINAQCRAIVTACASLEPVR